MLLAQNVNSKTFCETQNLAQQQISEDELSFETSELYHHNDAEIPISHVFFNIIPKPSNSNTSNEQNRELYLELIKSKTHLQFNLSFSQASAFIRYSSAFEQIYLKTACFRL